MCFSQVCLIDVNVTIVRSGQMVQGPGADGLGYCLCGHPYQALRLSATRRLLILMARLKDINPVKGVGLVSGFFQSTQRGEQTIPQSLVFTAPAGLIERVGNIYKEKQLSQFGAHLTCTHSSQLFDRADNLSQCREAPSF